MSKHVTEMSCGRSPCCAVKGYQRGGESNREAPRAPRSLEDKESSGALPVEVRKQAAEGPRCCGGGDPHPAQSLLLHPGRHAGREEPCSP